MATPSTFTFLDSYCERAGSAALLAEPLNAASNLAFIIAAFMAWGVWRNTREATIGNTWDMALLIISLFAIGVGSGLWHLFASKETMLLDVIPIVIFMNIYLVSAGIRLLSFPWWGGVLMFGLFQLFNAVGQAYLPPDYLNGTIMYIPAFVMLIFIVTALNLQQSNARHMAWKALLLFSVSLVFRTIDLEVCPDWPYGTHFLWHLFNACVLYLLLKALLLDFALKKR